ncbi:MAG: hypothetical protein ACFFC6_03105 [Promethearchaeota archaeon]
MKSDNRNIEGKISKEVFPASESKQVKEKKTLKTATFSEIVSFSKLTLIGTIFFVLAILATVFGGLVEYAEGRFAIALFGVTGLILFFGIVLDVLRWRGYTEWGALGAIIAYFGVFIMFLPLLLYPFVVDFTFEVLFIIELFGGVITIIGFTSHRTDFDDKIVDLLTILWYRLRTFDFRAFLSTLWQLVRTTVGGFLRYIWQGLKNFPSRIKTFFSMLIRLILNVLKTSVLVIGQTFKKSILGIWNNLHWIGLIAVIAFVLITPGLPDPAPFPIRLEMLIIIGFFFLLGVIYPYRERVAKIITSTRSFVLQKTISAYSMLSGSKLKPTEATFCSRCLRGIENREFESLKEIKRTVNPPCPFCGLNSWVRIEVEPTFADKLTREEELLQTTIEGSDIRVRDVQKTIIAEKPQVVEEQEIPTKDLDVVMVSIEDEKVIKKGKFPDFLSYQRAQNVGAQTYSELEYIDRVGAPDFETAEKIKEGGFAHFETYKKALSVGASTISELRLVEELNAPDFVTAKKVQRGRFPDYQLYLQAQDIGARTYSELEFMTIKRVEIKSTDVEADMQAVIAEKQTELKLSKPGPKFVQETEVSLIPDEITKKEVFKLTEDRESLIQAIEIFESIFNDHTLKPKGGQELFWNNKKTWFSTQTKRFLRGNISTGMFYNKMKSLNKDLRSTFKIPEERFHKVESDKKQIQTKPLSSEKVLINPDALKKPLKICPQCQFTNESTYTYCMNCGFELPHKTNTR